MYANIYSWYSIHGFQGYNNMMSKLNFKRDKIVDIQKALQSADINQDKQLDFDEWRQDLKAYVATNTTNTIL